MLYHELDQESIVQLFVCFTELQGMVSLSLVVVIVKLLVVTRAVTLSGGPIKVVVVDATTSGDL